MRWDTMSLGLDLVVRPDLRFQDVWPLGRKWLGGGDWKRLRERRMGMAGD